MSIQWTLVAGFLYVELAIIVILMLPLVKPSIWRSLFRSRFMVALGNQSHLYLYVFIGILLLFFCESIREFFKYGGELRRHEPHYAGSNAFYEDQMRLFRGQRNFYISGFALFSLFVIKRLASLLSAQALLKAEADASLRQAANISKHLQSLQAPQQDDDGGDSGEGPAPSAPEAENDKMVEVMKETVAKLQNENERLSKNLSALKQQAESTNREYDRLTEEYATLQNKYDRLTVKMEAKEDR